MNTRLVLFLLFAMAVACDMPYKEINPQWADKENVVRLTESKKFSLIGEPWSFEFSRDSQLFSVWDYEDTPPYDFSANPYIRVWDLNGKCLSDSIDSTKLFMASKYRTLFDKCALREAPFWDSINGKYSKFTPYPDILRYTMGWFVSPDWKYMVTFSNPLFEKWLKELKTNDNAFKPDFKTVTMRMWQLEPVVSKIWETTYKGFTHPIIGRFYSKNGALYLLIVYFRDVWIYSCNNGKLVTTFSLFMETPKEELQKRIRQFNLEEWYSSPFDAEFMPFKIAFSPEKEIVACQDDGSKRFRVFSAIPDFELIYAGNENESPKSKSSLRYASGPWIADGIQFGGRGKYLLVSFKLGTRARWRSIPQQLVTEIYDTDTWELIWQKNTEHIRNMTISHDGKKVALMRDNVFEIGDIDSFLKGYTGAIM